MLLKTLGASVLTNMFADKGVINYGLVLKKTHRVIKCNQKV